MQIASKLILAALFLALPLKARAGANPAPKPPFLDLTVVDEDPSGCKTCTGVLHRRDGKNSHFTQF